jgi:hypothetical protein
LLAESAEGFKREDILAIQDLKLKHGYLVKSGLKGYRYVEGQRPWTQFKKIDVALPCATQNEVSGSDAEALVKAGVKYVAEGSNMVSWRFPSPTPFSFTLSENLSPFSRDPHSKLSACLKTRAKGERRARLCGTPQERLATPVA